MNRISVTQNSLTRLSLVPYSLGLQLWDSSKVRILPYFGCADEFIASAFGSGGKCLVNCQMGVSRSATLAMVYLMLTGVRMRFYVSSI